MKNKLLLYCRLAALGLLFAPAACRRPEPLVRIHTRMGDLVLRLNDSTPAHRDNFLRLAQEGFYDSLLLHRVIRDFMIQGGDPTSRHAPPGVLLGEGGPGYDLPAEIGLPHLRGALAAARLPDAVNPDRKSNGSQFFIVQGRPQTDATLDELERHTGVKILPEWRRLYKQYGGAPLLDGQYTVFGQLVEGFEVLDQIAAVPRDGSDRPLEDIRMTLRVER